MAGVGKEQRGAGVARRVAARVAACGVVFALTLGPRGACAQGVVQGQVTITERPGESTTDLGNVVVSLEPVGGSRARPAPGKGEIAMERRRFSPQVIIVTPGSRVDFPNKDPFDHNIFSNEEKGSFDLGLYGRGESKPATFRAPGAFAVYCNIHSRMVGHVLVITTPYVTQAGADGRFELSRIPPGKYELHVWHNRAPEVVRPVTVTAAGLEGQDVQMDARGWKFVAHKNKFGQDYQASGERY